MTDWRTLDNTDNSDAADVVKVWKFYVLDDAVGVDVDAVDAVFNGSDKTRVPKMCRKCFLAYKKYSNSYDLLQDNLHKAVAALDLVPASTSIPLSPPSSKRPRVRASFSSQGSSLVNQSPDVVVCNKQQFNIIRNRSLRVCQCCGSLCCMNWLRVYQFHVFICG